MKISETELINVTVPIELETDLKECSLTLEDLHSLKTFNEKVIKFLSLFIKRVFDIVGAIIGIAILLPLTMIIAILNYCSGDKGPIFYSHERIGQNGKKLKMYKFRTMCVDAQEKLEKLLVENEETRKEWEENRKLKEDPRVTKIGAFLRKTSIDEFPQFLNVLKGEMSLVGPRPVINDEIKKFGLYTNKILSMKPGITGYWTSNGRSNTSYEERVLMESKYVDEFSIWLDIKILCKTVIVVIKKRGAM